MMVWIAAARSPPVSAEAKRQSSVPSPIEALQVVGALAAKEEELTRKRIGADPLLHLRGKIIETTPRIDRLAGKKHLRAGRQAITPIPSPPPRSATVPSRPHRYGRGLGLGKLDLDQTSPVPPRLIGRRRVPGCGQHGRSRVAGLPDHAERHKPNRVRLTWKPQPSAPIANRRVGCPRRVTTETRPHCFDFRDQRRFLLRPPLPPSRNNPRLRHAASAPLRRGFVAWHQLGTKRFMVPTHELFRRVELRSTLVASDVSWPSRRSLATRSANTRRRC